MTAVVRTVTLSLIGVALLALLGGCDDRVKAFQQWELVGGGHAEIFSDAQEPGKRLPIKLGFATSPQTIVTTAVLGDIDAKYYSRPSVFPPDSFRLLAFADRRGVALTAKGAPTKVIALIYVGDAGGPLIYPQDKAQQPADYVKRLTDAIAKVRIVAHETDMAIPGLVPPPNP